MRQVVSASLLYNSTGISVNERFHKEKFHDVWYPRVSSLVINFFKFVDYRNYTWVCCIIYMRAVQAFFLCVFFFNRFIRGGPLVKPDRELLLMFLRDVLLDTSKKINKRQMTGWNKHYTKNFILRTFLLIIFLFSYYYYIY